MTDRTAAGLGAVDDVLPTLLTALRCLECGAELSLRRLVHPGGYAELGPDGEIGCIGCGEPYPVIGGTPRMLRAGDRSRLMNAYPRATIRSTAAPVASPGEGSLLEGEVAYCRKLLVRVGAS